MEINKKLFDKLPKYAQKWEWIYLQSGYTGFGIDANCKASEDDNNKANLVFVCDSWEEFIWWVRKYKSEHQAQNRE